MPRHPPDIPPTDRTDSQTVRQSDSETDCATDREGDRRETTETDRTDRTDRQTDSEKPDRLMDCNRQAGMGSGGGGWTVVRSVAVVAEASEV